MNVDERIGMMAKVGVGDGSGGGAGQPGGRRQNANVNPCDVGPGEGKGKGRGKGKRRRDDNDKTAEGPTGAEKWVPRAVGGISGGLGGLSTLLYLPSTVRAAETTNLGIGPFLKKVLTSPKGLALMAGGTALGAGGIVGLQAILRRHRRAHEKGGVVDRARAQWEKMQAEKGKATKTAGSSGGSAADWFYQGWMDVVGPRLAKSAGVGKFIGRGAARLSQVGRSLLAGKSIGAAAALKRGKTLKYLRAQVPALTVAGGGVAAGAAGLGAVGGIARRTRRLVGGRE